MQLYFCICSTVLRGLEEIMKSSHFLKTGSDSILGSLIVLIFKYLELSFSIGRSRSIFFFKKKSFFLALQNRAWMKFTSFYKQLVSPHQPVRIVCLWIPLQLFRFELLAFGVLLEEVGELIQHLIGHQILLGKNSCPKHRFFWSEFPFLWQSKGRRTHLSEILLTSWSFFFAHSIFSNKSLRSFLSGIKCWKGMRAGKNHSVEFDCCKRRTELERRIQAVLLQAHPFPSTFQESKAKEK